MERDSWKDSNSFQKREDFGDDRFWSTVGGFFAIILGLVLLCYFGIYLRDHPHF